MGATPFIVGGPRKAFAAFVAITPSDTVSNPVGFIALMCSTGGTVSLLDSQGNTASLTLTAGVLYDLPPCVRVNATGTAALGLVGFA